MASLKDTKLSSTLFLLPGQDMNVMLKMLMLTGGTGSCAASLSCGMLRVQHQLLGMGPFSLFSLIHSLEVQGWPGGHTAARTLFLCLFWLC